LVATILVAGCGGGSSTETEIPKLIESFKDESDGNMVAANAMYKLVEIGEPAVPKLVEALESQDVRLKLMSLNTLGLIGPKASSAIPAVKKALTHPNKDVQNRARDAIAKIEGKPA
jgi:HEAT repeat protein